MIPPTDAKPTKTINPCVLESLLSCLSFKILQLSILLLWQRLLIIRSEIRLARAPCPASISHARGTMLAWTPRRAGLSVFMLLVKIYCQSLGVSSTDPGTFYIGHKHRLLPLGLLLEKLVFFGADGGTLGCPLQLQKILLFRKQKSLLHP